MGSLPNHVAIILDGNGRWAKKHSRPRIFGHRAGLRKIAGVVQWARDLGLTHLSLFCFSTENWNRPSDEVQGLMKLVRVAARRLRRSLPTARIRWLGSEQGLSADDVALLRDCESQTRHIADFNLNLAINYSGRDEILRAARRMAALAGNGQLSAGDLSRWQDLVPFLDTAEVPDVDLLIRTSGELRLSNFLLLQSAYAELYFTPTLWPDFTAEEFRRAIDDFGRRHRRFGQVDSAD